MGGSLLVGTLVARYLQPSAFGMLNIATAIYMLFNTASNLGLDYLVVRDVVLHPEGNHEVLGTAFWLKAIASVITTLAAVVFTWATHRADHVLILMVALLSVAAITQAFDVIDYFFQAKTLSRRTVIPKLFMFVVVNGLRLAGVFRHASVLFFVIIAAAEIVLGEVALLVSYRYFPHGLPPWKLSRKRARKLLRDGLPLVVASLLVMIYMRTDQILLAHYLGDRSVGLYSAAVRLSEVWYAIPVLICNSVMPKLLPSFVSNRPLYYARLQVVYNLMVLVSVILALGTLLVGHSVVGMLFGAAYGQSAPILSIHIWTGVFVFVGVLGGQQMVHEGLTIIEMRRALLGAVINVVLNILLIPRFGIAGSAYATLMAQAGSSYICDAFSRRTWHIFRMKSYALSGLWILQGKKAWYPAT
jgi:PST family polysaccharide transporter